MHRVIPPVKPYFPKEDIEQIKRDVEEILNSGMLTLHTYTKEFETQFARMCRVKYARAVNSGTSALEIALRAIGLEHGCRHLRKQSNEKGADNNIWRRDSGKMFYLCRRPCRRQCCCALKNCEKPDNKFSGSRVHHNKRAGRYLEADLWRVPSGSEATKACGF